jgi:hypothetical protein
MLRRLATTSLSKATLALFVLVCMLFWLMQVLQWSSPLTKPVAVTQHKIPNQSQGVSWQRLLTDAVPPTRGSADTTRQQWAQWQLLGLVSSQSGSGFAMLVNPMGEELLVRTSDALLPGVYLLEVHDQYVMVGASLQDAVTLKQKDK